MLLLVRSHKELKLPVLPLPCICWVLELYLCLLLEVIHVVWNQEVVIEGNHILPIIAIITGALHVWPGICIMYEWGNEIPDLSSTSNESVRKRPIFFCCVGRMYRFNDQNSFQHLIIIVSIAVACIVCLCNWNHITCWSCNVAERHPITSAYPTQILYHCLIGL